MKIAQIAPIVERIPPKKYGGTERVIYALVEELVSRGHDVTLFASGDSMTTAKLVSVYPRGIREAKLPDLYGSNPWTLLTIGTAYARQDAFDIIHDHLPPLSLPTAHIARRPVVATMHGAFSPTERRLFSTLTNPHVVTISHAQARSAGICNHIGTVHNGLAMDHYPFETVCDDYLLYVGRIAMDKGTHIAIAAAEELDQSLIIAAKLDQEDKQYFHEYVEPRLSERIRWIGEVDELERNILMSRARCLLHPATWKEPFGLVLIEAGACGCPVIAFGRGSIHEIIYDGTTGFVVDDLDSMIEAILRSDTIDRARCREHALKHFGAKAMADGYEQIYRTVLAAS